MGNSAPILMVLSCACAAVTKRPTAAALTKTVRNAFIVSSPHRFSLGQSLSTLGQARKATCRRVVRGRQVRSSWILGRIRGTSTHCATRVTLIATVLPRARPYDIPRKSAHDRPLRTQHGPGLSGSRRGQEGRVRVLRAQAAGPARLSSGRGLGRHPRLSRDIAFLAGGD